MRASQLSVVARSWLVQQGLDHLLPDPHSHEDVEGAIATYYPGGTFYFIKEVERNLGDLREPLMSGALSAVPGPVWASSPVEGPPQPAPTWFRPPEEPITKVCERDWCGKEFSTKKVHQRYCSLGCREGWRPLDRPTIDSLLGKPA